MISYASSDEVLAAEAARIAGREDLERAKVTQNEIDRQETLVLQVPGEVFENALALAQEMLETASSRSREWTPEDRAKARRLVAELLTSPLAGVFESLTAEWQKTASVLARRLMN